MKDPECRATARILAAVAVLCLSAACGVDLPTEEELKTLLSEATEITSGDAVQLFSTVSLDEMENQSVSAVVLWAAPIAGPCSAASAPESGQEVEVSSDIGSVVELVECFWPGGGELPVKAFHTTSERSLRDLGRYPSATLFRPEHVNSIELERQADSVSGEVWFEKPGCFKGQLAFSIGLVEEQWSVKSFTLPELGWRVERQPSGRWSAVFEGTRVPESDAADVEPPKSVVIRVPNIPGGNVDVDGLSMPLSSIADLVKAKPVIVTSSENGRLDQVADVLESISLAQPPPVAVNLALFSGTRSRWAALRNNRSEPAAPLTAEGIWRNPGWLCTPQKLARHAYQGLGASVCFDGEATLASFFSERKPRRATDSVEMLGLLGGIGLERCAAVVVQTDSVTRMKKFESILASIGRQQVPSVFWVHGDSYGFALTRYRPSRR